jgi:Zn-dependent M28 family amino/carboxypeptidase
MLLVEEKQIPWDLRVRAARQLGSSQWLPGRPRQGVQAIVYISRPAAERIIGQSLDRAVPADALGSARLEVKSEAREVRSANVYAMLRGSDPSLSLECLVVTAHLDHVGVGTPLDGDTIYNGAVDNASGVAALLTMVKAFLALPQMPARSVIFVATTAEEQGELGADYFVHHSPVPLERIVAAVNVDGLSFTAFKEVEAAGGSNSSLGLAAQQAAAQLALGVKNEPIGVGGSDHAPFLLAAVPVLWLGAALSDDWMRTRYHSPKDDMSQPLDFAAAVTYSKLVFITTYLVAQAHERPMWKGDEFFSYPHQ